MIKMSIQSLKNDLSKSLFYFLTFLLNTIFIFSFFNLVFQPGAHIDLGKEDTTFVTPIAVFVIVVAMICVFLANNFYVSYKSKEIAVYLISGASVYQVGRFLFFQVFIIMLLAIPLGVVIGYLFIPVINLLFQDVFTYHGDMFYYSSKTGVACGTILAFEVFWCSFLNLGYCIRSTLYSILRGDNNKIKLNNIKFKELFGEKKIVKKISAVYDRIFILLYAIPVIIFMFLDDPMSFLFVALFGMIGIYGMIKMVIPAYIRKRQKNESLQNSVMLISLGFFDSDLKKAWSLVLIILLSAIFLTGVIIYTLEEPLVSMVALMSYFAVMVLMALTIVFKLGMELNKRKKSFLNLSYLGYSLSQLKKAVFNELVLFYGVILGFPVIYQIIILLRMFYLNWITLFLMIIILMIQIGVIFIAFVISYQLYKKIIPVSMIVQK